jgi:hypothetical protein
MSIRQRFAPLPIRTLLYNLDAAIVACAELLTASNPHDLLRLELTAISHVLQARAHMRELQPADNATASQVALFLTVTDCLEEKSSPNQTVGLEAAANRLIAGQIPVATLVALAAAMRDVLELSCAPFDEDAAAPAPALTPVSEALVWATGPEAG